MPHPYFAPRMTAVALVALGTLAIGCSGSSDDPGTGSDDASASGPDGTAIDPGGGDDAGGGGGGAQTDGAVPLDAPDSTRDAHSADANDANACPPFVPNAALEAKRAACTFTAGAQVADTVDDAAAARAAITHVIVLTHENRSLDHMYGTMGGGIEGFPKTYSNPMPDGGTAFPTHLATACPADISHSPQSIGSEWDNGKMDGFYKTDGPGSLGYYDAKDHPFYSWLVTTFAMSDQYFCSMMGPTGLNRRFLYGASATSTANHIFDEMTAKGVSWGNYYVGKDPIYNTYTFPAGDPHLHAWSTFSAALDAGTLPSVTYLDTPSDEHPAGSMHDGENVVRDVIQHAFASPLWPHLAIIFNYDEGGGFFDHVAPPAACLPSSSAADKIYDREGFRVPLVVISPYSRRGYVSHTVHSHTSVMRFVELLHDLPAVTARDANSDALLDMFDFKCPDFKTPPALGPASPKGC